MCNPPPLGLAVVLERAGAAWADAEVVGYDGDTIVLSRISGAVPGSDAVPVDATLVWSTERGLFRGPVQVTPAEAGWRALLHGTTTRIQRREYMRLRLGTPLTLGHDQGHIRGTLVDLSEAALRARVEIRHTPSLRRGDSVRAAFTLHHTGFMLRGTVLRAERGAEHGTLDVVVMLDIPARTANDLRRNVVYVQAERQADEPWVSGPLSAATSPDGRDDLAEPETTHQRQEGT